MTLGWDQPAPNANELAAYTYVLYVDGVAVVLTNATCGALSGESQNAACSSPLPALQPGQRTLELGTRVTWDGVVRESARSAPLVVTVAGSASSGFASLAAAPPSGSRPTEVRGPDGTPYVIETVASGLDRPSALARLPDGRLLIAERRGRVRIADAGVLLDTPALELTDAATEAGEGWSLAVAPDFAATRHVYVSFVARDAGGARVGRVVRFREVGGMLGEPAVLVDGLPVGAARRVFESGPTVRCMSARRPTLPGTPTISGRTQARSCGSPPPARRWPAARLAAPRSSRSGIGGRGSTSTGTRRPGPCGARNVCRGRVAKALGRRATTGAEPAFLEGIQAAGAAFHAGATPAAWRNSLFLASPEDECLYRVSGLGSSPPEPAVEPLFARRFGRITAVLSGDDGLYFATGNGDTDDRGRPTDAIFRIRDAGARPDSAALRLTPTAR